MKSRRDAREAEGARLLSEYPPLKGIEGSNPSLSAKFCIAKFDEISPFCFYKMADPPVIPNMYYVYILLNETKTRTDTGVTDDVDKRLTDHNAGRVKSSSPYRPYKIVHLESFKTMSEARQKEKFYKSTIGRRKLKKMVFT